ncbi:MAG: MerR family transcriptional regulator [Nitriliruptoraceae bacterium]
MRAVADDEHAPFDLDDVAAEAGTTRVLLEAVERAGLLLPHHIDDTGVARYSPADVQAVQAGLAILDAGLPLAELLDIARHTDDAVAVIADAAVEAFLRFIRDPAQSTSDTPDELADRLITAYQRMLPATERLVAHHLRRRLLAKVAARVAEEADAPQPHDTKRATQSDGGGTAPS